MVTVHDDGVVSSLKARVQTLRPDTTGRWGRMSVDQMLWHLNSVMAMSLGQLKLEKEFVPLPAPVLRFLILNVPWIKGAPTMKALVAGAKRFDFETEKTRCLTLLDAVAAKKISESWSKHPVLGEMTGTHWSTLHAKHVEHHLKQFGA